MTKSDNFSKKFLIILSSAFHISVDKITKKINPLKNLFKKPTNEQSLVGSLS